MNGRSIIYADSLILLVLVRTALWIRSAGSAEKAAQFEIRMKTVEKMNKDQEVYNALLDQIKSGERDWVGFEWGTDYAA